MFLNGVITLQRKCVVLFCTESDFHKIENRLPEGIVIYVRLSTLAGGMIWPTGCTIFSSKSLRKKYVITSFFRPKSYHSMFFA